MAAPGKSYPATVFLVVHSGFSARYLLRTDIFNGLRAVGLQIVILSPNADEKYFRDEFIGEGVQVEALLMEKCTAYLRKSRFQRFIRRVRLQASGNSDRNTSIHVARKLYRNTGTEVSLIRKLLGAAESVAVSVLSSSRKIRQWLLEFESRFFAGHFHRELFKRYRPAMVVTTSLGYWHPDEFIMREARAHGALVVPVILSWDNTSSYGLAAARSDYVVAWTELMKRELVEYNDIDPGKIFVGGVCHFDIYHWPEELYSRKTLFRRFGFETGKDLIFFATKSPNTYPWNPDIVEIISEAIQNGEIRKPSQLIVRLHPIYLRLKNGELEYQEEIGYYRQLEKRYPFLRVNLPEVLSKKLSLDCSSEELILLGSLLKHAGVMVNLFSTVTIEASLFDLPSINVAFDGDSARMRKRRHTVAFDEEQEHNQRVIRTGGVAMARSPRQLIDKINDYLEHPEKDREGRKTIRTQECGVHPGEAGRKVAAFLSDLLDGGGNK